MDTNQVRITEEVPGCEYSWFVAGDPIKPDLHARNPYPTFDTLKEAKSWCESKGYSYRVEPFEL